MAVRRFKKTTGLVALFAVLLVAGIGVLVMREVSADVLDLADTCTGADVNIVQADFGGSNPPVFNNQNIYAYKTPTPAGPWLHTGTAPHPETWPRYEGSGESARLVIGSTTEITSNTSNAILNKIPVNTNILYKLPSHMRKDRLYEFRVQFETALGQNEEKVFPQLGVIVNNASQAASSEVLKSTADNKLTEITKYYSPLRDYAEAGRAYPEEFFYLKINNNDYSGTPTQTGVLKIKKISIKESCTSTLAKTNPNLFKTVIRAYTYAPTPSAVASGTAYHKAVPWNSGELNTLVTSTPSPALASSTNPTTIFSHDTDSLDPLYQPAQSEVIGQAATENSAKMLSTTAAKGEKKRVYFSLHNNSVVSSVKVSTSNFIQGETPPAEGETEAFQIGPGWTNIGPKDAISTQDFTSEGLYAFQMFGSSWKIAEPGKTNFYSGAPAGLYIYNPGSAKTVNATVVSQASVEISNKALEGWNLFYNNTNADITAGKFMIKTQEGSVTQSKSLFSLVDQGAAYTYAPVILSTQGSTANYDYVDASNSGAIIPAKKAFWFYIWPTEGARANDANIAYAADSSSSAVSPSGTVYSMRLKAKQSKENFTGTYSLVNEIIEPFTQMSNTSQNNLAAGRNESFSVEVNVPENISAGWYAANVYVTVNGKKEALPLKVRVRDFTLEDISSPRLVYPPNEIWNTSGCKVDATSGSSVTTGCAEVNKQIDAFVGKTLDAGFNGYELSAVLGTGQYLGQVAPLAGNATGFTLSPSSQYLLSKAKTDSRITAKYLIGFENLVGEVMYRKGYITDKEKSDYIKQSILLGLENPITSNGTLNTGGTFNKKPYNVPPTNEAPNQYYSLQPLDAAKITEIENQVKTVLSSIDSQIATATGKSKFWTLYAADEAGRGSGELAIGAFNGKIAKSININSFITGNSTMLAQSKAYTPADFKYFCYGVGGLDSNSSTDVSSPGNERTPCFYGTGAYNDMMGTEIKNRYLSGLRSYGYGINYFLFWKYTSAPYETVDPVTGVASATDQMDDFNRKGISWNGGRDWLTEYYNNEKYRASYEDYYGTRGTVDSLATGNKYQNITTQEFVGLEEANTDIKYIETLAKKPGWDAAKVKAKIDALPDDLKLPVIRRTLFGTNMTKEKLNRIRDLIADEIEK